MMTAASSGHDMRSNSNSNMLLLLSLNLILLAFFILLNSLADFETDRSRAVLASVKQAFNGQVEAAGQEPSFSGSLGALPEVEAKMREVGSLFEAIAPTAWAKSIRRANSVRVDISAGALFKPGSQRLRQGREALFERLAESLRKGPEGAPRYLLEILVGTGSRVVAGGGPAAESTSPDSTSPDSTSPDSTSPESKGLGLRRAAVLAARLSTEGVPLGALSTGLRPGAAGSLRFVLRLRPEPGAAAGSEGGEG